MIKENERCKKKRKRLEERKKSGRKGGMKQVKKEEVGMIGGK